MYEIAKKKLDDELKNFKGDQYAKAVSGYVHGVLLNFCQQEPEFAQAIVQNDKTLSDACAAATKEHKQAMSDLEVCRKAVEFYFPGAGVEFKMTIDLCASVKPADETTEKRPRLLKFNLEDLLDD